MQNETPQIGIIGAGMMGASLAAAHLRHEMAVRIFDTSSEILDTVQKRVAAECEPFSIPFCGSHIKVDTDLEGWIQATPGTMILIETITEKPRAKQKLYRKIQDAFSKRREKRGDYFVFSNTSTLSIRDLAEPFDDVFRARFLGFHFFHPVQKRPLIEVIPSCYTNAKTSEIAREHALRLKKEPLFVQDGPGFFVNRILNAYLSAALKLLENGVHPLQIEWAATDFGMEKGPLELMDEIGLDVVLHGGWVLLKAFPERVTPSNLLLQLIERGHFGKKSGRGFFEYENAVPQKREQPVSEFLQQYLEPLRKNATEKTSDAQIIDALLSPMYREACLCLEEGIIPKPTEADRASVLGLGFPHEKSGIASWGQNR